MRLMQKKMGTISDDFGLRRPVIQKRFQAKNATSIVACVLLRQISPVVAQNAHGIPFFVHYNIPW